MHSLIGVSIAPISRRLSDALRLGVDIAGPGGAKPPKVFLVHVDLKAITPSFEMYRRSTDVAEDQSL